MKSFFSTMCAASFTTAAIFNTQDKDYEAFIFAAVLAGFAAFLCEEKLK